MARKKESQTPTPLGEILLEEFLEPMKITRARVAKATGIPRKVISEIIAGNRELDKSQAEALGKFLGTGPEFWVNLSKAPSDLSVKHDKYLTEDFAGWETKLNALQKKLGPKAKKLDITSENDVFKSLPFAGKAKTLKEMEAGIKAGAKKFKS